MSALRPYQQDAVDAAIAWMKTSIMPACMDLSVGAGKSFILAHIAKWVHETSGKKTLVLQPSIELVQQNHEKFLTTGYPASIFSASAGSKCMRHSVIYATPQSVKNVLSRFGDQVGAVLIDECDQTTPTIRMIIDSIRVKNPLLRVLGVTGTPYTTSYGYIYQYDIDGAFMKEDVAAAPYYNRLLYRITTRELINMGFLTMAHADPDHAASYDTAGLELASTGKFTAASVERAFEGRGRLTASIVADVVRHAQGRKGVMIFAATVEHAKEIMESLPPDNARMIGGKINMKKKEREVLIADFKARRFKYIVNVQTLNVGFDAPHVDVIAILRATESARLLQQIIGRGLRLCDGKQDCLVLDYAENIERHSLEDDMFAPDIRVKGATSGSGILDITCPDCGFSNEFSARKNPDEFAISDDGYFLDLTGEKIETEHGPMPAHYGRRCTGQVRSRTERGVFERCDHRWTCKECPECAHQNDIAARFCEACKAELVNPNDKLKQEFHKIKADPYSQSTDKVLEWSARKTVTQAGRETLLCHYKTEQRKFRVWYNPESSHPQGRFEWRSLCDAVFSGHIAPDIDMFLKYLHKGKAPETVTVYREKGSSFYRIVAHNRPEDEAPE